MYFLYYLSHDIYKNAKAGQLCDKIYYLNKIFHSVDLFYAIDLPNYFGAEHPLGSVMGRAQYSNGFFFYQGCSRDIGSFIPRILLNLGHGLICFAFDLKKTNYDVLYHVLKLLSLYQLS